MKVFVDTKEAYTPTHCEECHEQKRITIKIADESIYLCLKCIRLAESLLAAKGGGDQ